MSSDNATALEDYQEHLEIKAAHWMFDHVNDTDFESKWAAIKEYVAWSAKETERDLNATRGRDGKSFIQRRAAATIEKGA